ncbi:MAG: helix-turn-helix domain-containing protein [Chitinispirillales bacterium]|jgi:transcriptional regulator with XRE-family HTH domain|nr:helix-turn-helix domain-containing protein [Chitinispirillales bacterium]
MSLHERVKELRKRLGLTQVEFGKRVGIVQGHLTGIESGKKSITAKTFKVISSTYGVSEEWLRTGKGEMFNKNPDKRAARIIRFFNELTPEYQDFMLLQLDHLFDLQTELKQTGRKKLPSKKLPS